MKKVIPYRQNQEMIDLALESMSIKNTQTNKFELTKMELNYHKIMFRIKRKIWFTWHCRMRMIWDSPNDFYRSEDRPFYHICCNGNTGGGRTALCDILESGYRYHQEKLELHYEPESGDDLVGGGA